MTIAEAREKCKSSVAAAPRDVLIITLILLASLASFGLGWLTGREAGQGSATSATEPLLVADSGSGQIVASKNGTKYYLPSCSGAGRISEANKIWFASSAAAVAAGYSPAANCKGL
ncbi:MAG: hypothetical protein WAV50_03180 [Minisyncoccia bacterium]